MNRPSSGAATTSGSTLAVQCARHFTSTVSASMCRSADRISRSSEPSSRSAWNSRSSPSSAGQQRADPQDRRADAGEQVEVRPDREGYGRDDGQKEQHAGQRAAAGADAEAQVAEEEGEH